MQDALRAHLCADAQRRAMEQQLALRYALPPVGEFAGYEVQAYAQLGTSGLLLLCTVDFGACDADEESVVSGVKDEEAVEEEELGVHLSPSPSLATTDDMCDDSLPPPSAPLMAGDADVRDAPTPSDAPADAAQHRTVMVAVKAVTERALRRGSSLQAELCLLLAVPRHPNLAALLAHADLDAGIPLPPVVRKAMPTGTAAELRRALLAEVVQHASRTLEDAARSAPAAHKLRWCLDVAAALAHLWRHGYVHMSVMPCNVLIADEECDPLHHRRSPRDLPAAGARAMLTNFGSAARVGPAGSLLLPLGRGLPGSAAHVAPEVRVQWEEAGKQRGAGCERRLGVSLHWFQPQFAHVEVDARGQEVWALGVLMHEVLAGAHPYPDYARMDLDSMQARLPAAEADVPLAEPALRQAGVGDAVLQLLRRMLSVDPRRRPRDPVEAYRQLLQAAQHDAQRDAGAAVAVPSAQTSEATEGVPAAAAPVHSAGPDGASEDCAAVALDEVSTAFARSQLSVAWRSADGCPAPNRWAQQLEAWSAYPDAGGAAAAMHLARLLWDGKAGMRRDRRRAQQLAERALEWCARAAGEGVAAAQTCLAWWQAVSAWQGSDLTALEWLQRAAEQGDAEAQHMLGCWLGGDCDGVAVPPCAQDAAQAEAWLTRAANKGHAGAQAALGLRFGRDGAGANSPRAQAGLLLLHRAAGRGSAQAQCALGCCYHFGHGVTADAQHAAELFALAAEQGHAQAQFNLGVCLTCGDGVPQDAAEGTVWIQRAAEQGYAQAIQYLQDEDDDERDV